MLGSFIPSCVCGMWALPSVMGHGAQPRSVIFNGAFISASIAIIPTHDEPFMMLSLHSP